MVFSVTISVTIRVAIRVLFLSQGKQDTKYHET